MPGNAHVTRLNLFQDVDAWYSYSFSTPEGNIRSYFCTQRRGILPTGDPVARFRLVKREEVMINFNQLTPDTVIAIIGKFSFEYFRERKFFFLLSFILEG